MDLTGKVLYEESYEYKGNFSECKGGALRAQREASASAKESYRLQQEMFEFQKQEALKLEAGQEAKAAKEAANAERLLSMKRAGRASTLTSIAKRPSLEDFKSKYQTEHPSATPDEIQEEYEKLLPFERKIIGIPVTKKASLYA